MSHPGLIVVGGGSAGCIVAHRLANQFRCRVTLVEPESDEAPKIDSVRPCRWLHLLGSSEDWGLETEANEHLAGRRMPWPRGRGLGGCNRINAMIWFPPRRLDLQHLVAAAGDRWSETQLRDAWECVEARVQWETPSWLSDASVEFLEAASRIPNFVPMVYRRLNHRGRRWLPSELLHSGDTPIQIVRGSADSLIWDGDKVIGVRVSGKEGRFDLRSDKGVVLCAGTIATPTILLRSGIGPSDDLAGCRVDVRVNAPSVGSHLRDHLIMPVVFARTPPCPPFRSRPSIRDLAKWMTIGSGPVASNLAECGGMTVDQSIQVHVTPTHYMTYPKQDETAAMTIGVNLTQPRSSGNIRLNSRAPDNAPIIQPRYLDDPADLERMVQAVRLARDLAEQSPLTRSLALELIPGPRRTKPDQIARAIGHYAQTLYHPVGTCRMGTESLDPIDHNLSLRGASQLWVVDASILPKPTLGNPNATIMTVAWIAAERIASQL